MLDFSSSATFFNMKRNDLTPTVVTDKNGKITTVHKKPAGTPRGSALPSPQAQPQDRMKELSSRVAEAMEVTHGRQDLPAINKFLRNLGDLAEAFVEVVEKAARDALDGYNYGTANFSYLVIALADADPECRRILAYHDVFPENIALTDVRFILKKIAESYDGDKFRPEYREKVRAHLYAAANYQRHNDTDYAKFDYEGNDELFNLVMRRPADVEEIMRLHNDYKVPLITDEVIEEYRNHHASLGHGIL